jgi:signal transduction histidine kinase
MVFADPRPELFTTDRLELLEAVARQATGGLQNSKLYQNLLQEKERITEIHEEARKKLARDLHDGPTQSISAIAMRVNFARRLIERDVKSAADELFKIEELARRTTKEIRQMLFTLRPLVLESQGLVPALEQLADKVHETYSQEVLVEAQPRVADDMEVGKQGVVFFIAEEAVNNARKHAQAPHIWIRLTREGELFRMEIEDDGVGFDLGAVESNYEARGSLGMVNLRERTELVSGVIRITSIAGKGTRISLTVPLTVAAAERLHQNGFVG